jgi:hypothetical protein
MGLRIRTLAGLLRRARKLCCPQHFTGRLWNFPHFTHAWETGFAHLTAYISENRSAHFPFGTMHDGFQLGNLVPSQRRNKDTMLSARRARLEGVQMLGMERHEAFAVGHSETGPSIRS